MPKVSYHLNSPNRRDTSVIFASPHSGGDYPRSFVGKTVLDDHMIRSSEDAFVDQLFAAAPNIGAPLLLAGAPRAFVDLNRSADEMDPALIKGARQHAHANPRIAAGLGVIPRVVAGGRAIYRGKLTIEEARDRIDRYWRPYHDTLRRLLAESHQLFGEAILIDCHSMPREATNTLVRSGVARPDVVLGDRFGASAAPEVVERIEAAFATAGFTVARNAPFAGAYTTQAYGRPAKGQHVVQIEIDRSLYMDESTITPHSGFKTVRRLLTKVMADIADIGRPETGQLAAE